MSGVTDNYGLILPAKGEGYTVDIINQNNIAIDAELKARELQAHGLKSVLKVTASSGAITALTVIQNIPSYSFKGGRKYTIEWDNQYLGSVAGNYINVSVATCAVADSAALTAGLTQLNGRQYKIHDASQSHAGGVTALYEPTADTTLQLKFLAQVVVGAGTTTIVSSAVAPSIITIKDEGDQF